MARTSTGGTPRLSKSALMQQHLQAWKHSGLSQRAYLDTTGVSKTLFSYWQRKLSPELPPTVPDSPGFVAVSAPELAAEVTTPARVFARIRCCDGRELELHEPVSSDYLRALLS